VILLIKRNLAMNCLKPPLSFILLGIVLFLAACRGKDEAPPTPRPTSTNISTVPGVVNTEAIDWPPQVVYSSPVPGEEITLDGAITIRFDQPMARASVEDAFAISKAQEEAQAVQGTFTWTRDDTVIFTPSENLDRKQLYRVHISTGARGQNGISMESPIVLNVETIGFIAVSQVIPAPDNANVQADSAITVLFNRPIVPLTATAQQVNLPQPLTFDPPLVGIGEWISTSIYRYVPKRPLDGATTYQATVHAGLEDIVGAVLEEDFTWNFTTVVPSVVRITPTNRSKKVAIESGFGIEFNMPMDRASTESAISLSPAASLEFTWQNEDRTVLIIPTHPLELEMNYTLAITTAARSAYGNASLDRHTSSDFRTIPYPSVASTTPKDGEAITSYYSNIYSIYIEFASPMIEETIKGKIHVEPAPEPDDIHYEFWNFDEEAESLGITSVRVEFPIRPDTTYVVTVPGSAADPYGNTLGEDYVFSFTSLPLPPIVSLNLPYNLSQLTTSYTTRVEIGYRSTPQVNVALYDLGLPLNYLNEPYLVYEREIYPGAPSRAWSFPVEESDRVNVLEVPLADGGVLAPGIYLLTAESKEPKPRDFYYQENRRNLLIVADTNLVVKETFGMVYVWATDLETGKPASGRIITLYNHRNREVGQATTDKDGLARIPYTTPEDNYLQGVLAVSNSPGAAGFGVGSSNWDISVQPYQFGLSGYNLSDEAPTVFYLITDRPIYRPGDTVYFRGVLRDQHYGRYAVSPRQSVGLRVVYTDQYYNQEDKRVFLNLDVDGNGNFSGEFHIPDDWALGSYSLSSGDQGIQGERSFTVAEYRAPEFFVSVTPTMTETLRGEAVEVTIEAGYFFGGPATDLGVNWSVIAERYYLPWDGPTYSFSDEFGGWFYLLSGEGVTGADGKLTVTLPPDLLDDLKGGSWTVNLEASVYDVSEFPVTARASLIQHGGATYVGIAPGDYLNQAGAAAEFNLITVGWDRQPHPNRPVEVVFYRRVWQSERVEQNGQFVTRWAPVDTEVARVQTTTDTEAEAKVAFTPEVGGEYMAKATVTDVDGKTMTSTTYLWVIDPNYSSWRSSPRERRMELTPDRDTYTVGDKATILVQSPFDGPVNAWLIIERGVVIEERLIALDNRSDTIEIPIGADYAPNVYVSVVAVQGTLGKTAFADIRLGMTELKVNPEQLSLNVAITADRALYQPGETATYTIQVTDYQGRPVQADVSLALVDLAVLSLKPDNAPPILEAFYADQPLRSRLGSGLFHSGEGLELEFPQGFIDGYGGGGNGAPSESLALRSLDDVRKEFRDTAYWAAVVKTDASVSATVSVSLPDNLTTWRMSAKAATADTLVGQSFTDIVSSKPLLIRPVTPRFMTVGDVIEFGAIVNNNTGSRQTVTVRLDASGVRLQTDAERTITIPAAGSRLVRWPAVVEDVETADLTFRVSNAGYSDASKPTFGIGPEQLIPVYRYTGEDIVGTSGMMTEPDRRVEGVLLPPGLDERQGTVEVAIRASLAAALLDALDYNETYDFPPACAYGYADRLLSASSIVYALDKMAVGNAAFRSRLSALVHPDIAALEGLQFGNGGWGWCYSERSDDYLTGNVFFALLMAERAGFSVKASVMNKAAAYLEKLIVPPRGLEEVWKINRQAYYLYLLAGYGRNKTAASADALFNEHRDLLHHYAKAHLAMVYELTGNGGSAAQQSLIADLYDMANLSAAGAHWENNEQDWNNLSSDISGTAITLSALLQVDPGNQILPNVVRWLMVARTAGHWPSTYETAWSIHALADWMVVTGELNADYDYSFRSNLVPLAEGAFNQDKLDETVNVSIPLNTLSHEDVNFLDFQYLNGTGNLYYTAYLDSYIDAKTVSATSRGIAVQRVYYNAACDPEKEVCEPIAHLAAGQQVRVQLTIIAESDLLYVIVEDSIPSGSEAIDPGLETSASNTEGGIRREDDLYGYWGWWYFNRIEYRDEKVVFYSEFLPAGTYQYTYYLQTTIPGVYQVRPTLARQEFFPEVFGRSDGLSFVIEVP
jgi:alpha-2-macroglobulin